jgi:transposase
LEAKRKLGVAEDAPVSLCYEAGRDGFYPYRRLTERGHRVHVIDSASIAVSRRKRRAKSDGIDAAK